ncbi:MAG: hypothetical protein H6Q74_669 [Firmicutes bacterium]|nr:hypothetical protein [Bacillota bacterium]
MLNIIYYCFAGAHASVVASAIHCGLLPRERVPSRQEFLAVPYYDRTLPELVGQPYFMGLDECGNKVYFMGMWSQRLKIITALGEFLDTAGVKQNQYFFQDAFPLINFSTKLGGLLSKRCHFTEMGRSITVWGIKRRYPCFVELVKKVKQQLT